METVTHLPAVLAVAAPLLLAAKRAGWLRPRRGRAVAGVLVLAAIVWAWPRAGLELPVLERLTLLLAGAALVWLLRAKQRPPRARPDMALVGLVAAAAVVYWNFGAFHGARTFVHLHDVGHYYLGAKYFEELGYENLYTATLRAEAELFDDRFKTLEARDLATDDVVHIRSLLERSGPVKQAFRPERWRDFCTDVRWLRERMGANLPRFYLDHGFNPTPVWIAIAAPLANAVPAGDHRFVALLTALDPLLVAVALAGVAWAFGLEAALLAALYGLIAYGAGFAWIGGAFLRFGWLAALVIGVCLLARGRPVAAGIAVALAGGLRIFPALFVAMPAIQALGALRAEARRSDPAVRFVAAAAVTALALVALTAAGPRGLGAWREFERNAERYLGTVSPNVVGLLPIVAFQAPREVDADTFAAIRARRGRIHDRLTFLVLPLVALALAWRYRSGPLLEGAVVGGLVLAFAGLALAAYYWVAAVLLALVGGEPRRHAIALFAIETSTYTIALFEPSQGVVFAVRSALVLYFLAFAVVTPPRAPAWRPPP